MGAIRPKVPTGAGNGRTRAVTAPSGQVGRAWAGRGGSARGPGPFGAGPFGAGPFGAAGSAAAPATAAAATAAGGGGRCGRTRAATAGHGHGGQELDGVGVPARAGRRLTGLRHRTVDLEGIAARAAAELVPGHGTRVRPGLTPGGTWVILDGWWTARTERRFGPCDRPRRPRARVVCRHAPGCPAPADPGCGASRQPTPHRPPQPRRPPTPHRRPNRSRRSPNR